MIDIRKFEPLWGEWRSIKLLKQGVYGKVYLMEKVELGKRYYAAVKYISIPDASNMSEMLRAEGLARDDSSLNDYYQQLVDDLMTEINLNDRLKSSNIVSYDAHLVVPQEHEPGFDIFIKMEFLASLKEYTMSHSMTVRDVARLGEDICAALTVIQQEKVRHWGIEPDDIFVNTDGGYKLGNIGESKVSAGIGGDRTVKGIESFMSPEVARGEEGDYCAGLYSLGLVLYRLMNNNRGPFLPQSSKRLTDSMNNSAQKRRLQGEALPPPAFADESIGGIILKACAYEPGDRWENAAQMQNALRNYRQSLSQETAGTVVLDRKKKGSGTSSSTASVHTEETSEAMEEEKELLSEVEGTALRPDEEAATSLSDEGRTFSLPLKKPTFSLPVDGRTFPLPFEKKTFTPTVDEAPVLPPREVVTFSMLRQELETQKPSVETEKKKKKPWVPVIVAVCAVAFVVILVMSIYTNRGGEQTGNMTEGKSPLAAQPLVIIRDWQDPVIEAGVRKALGTKKGKLDPHALAGLEELNLSGSVEPISTLADLSMLPGLKRLDLSGHTVALFDFPDNMAQLTALNLTGCGCTDLEFMKNPMLQGIINLALGSNQVLDLNPLAGLTELQYLNISGNPVLDLTALSGLPNIKTVVAQNVSVSDWSPVSGVEQVDGGPETATPPTATVAPPTTPHSTPSQTPKPKPTPPPSTVAVTSINLSRSSILLAVGDMITLSAQISPSNATNQKVTWSSSASSVAKVDSNGNITAVGNGTAIITASCGGRSATCAISIG